MNRKKLTEQSKAFWNRCFKKTRYDYKRLAANDWTKLIKRLKKFRVKRVLDLGCGFGHWSIALSRAGFQVSAVDTSWVAVKILRKWAREDNLNITVKTMSALNVPALNARFNAVLCNSMLDHVCLADARKITRNIKKILYKNGIAYISFDGPEKLILKNVRILPDRTWLFKRGKLKDMLWRYYTNEEIKHLFRQFKIIKSTVRKNGKRDVWLIKK